MYNFYPSFTTTKHEFGIIYTLCIMNYFSDFLKFGDNFIDYFSAPVYHLLTVLVIFAYMLIVIGVTYINPDYTGYLTLASQTFIAIVLILRFNPLRKHMVCSENDRTLVLASSFFLLFNDEYTHFVTDYMKSMPIVNYMRSKLTL
jgi:hypothetical protein